MTKLTKEISVFFPVYNLEAQVEKTVSNAFRVVPKLAQKYEIIVVNDGSTDKTSQKLKKISLKYPSLKVINHSKNRGYGAALKSGFYNSKYSLIAFTDADGQFDISELSSFIDVYNKTKADLVIGYYKDRKVSMFKKITSKIWEFAVFVLFDLKVKDIDCGFKLISKRVIDSIPKLNSERGAFISSELLINAKRKGFKFEEIGVSHFKRKEGKGTGRDMKVILNSFKDLIKFWWRLRWEKK